MPRTSLSRADAQAMRRARDHEDSRVMTFDAIVTRVAKVASRRLVAQPDLDAAQLAVAVRADISAEMADRTRRSAEVRCRRRAEQAAETIAGDAA